MQDVPDNTVLIPEEIIQIVAEMRLILAYDLDERDISLAVQLFNDCIEAGDFLVAWECLTAPERSAWRNYGALDEFVRNERLRIARLKKNANH